MTYTICVLAGLVIGGLAAWLIASARITKSFTFKIEESERRANLAEGRASGLEATVTELRGQNQKAFEDFNSGPPGALVWQARRRLRKLTRPGASPDIRLP